MPGLWKLRPTANNFSRRCQAYRERVGALQAFSRYEAAPNIFWNDEQYRGEAYSAYAWAVYVAAVTVDTATYSDHR